MASLKKRPRNTRKQWEVRWRESGRSRRRSFTRKEEANAWLKRAVQIEDDERAGRFGPPTQVLNRTLEDQFKLWQDTRVHLAWGTRDKDQWVWQRWIKPHLGHRRLGTLTYRDLNDVLAKASEKGNGADTRIAIYTRLNMILDDALGPDGHTCRRAVAGTSKREREINPLSRDEVERLLTALEGRDRLLVDVLATMGLRPHEALMLRGRDVGQKTLHVRTKKGKKEAVRLLPLPGRLGFPLTNLAAEVGRDGLLFPVPDWRNWRKRVWLPAIERAGLTGTVPYDLRHTVASRLISLGATPNDVAEWMGHSVKMALETYGHLFPGRKDELASMLDW